MIYVNSLISVVNQYAPSVSFSLPKSLKVALCAQAAIFSGQPFVGNLYGRVCQESCGSQLSASTVFDTSVVLPNYGGTSINELVTINVGADATPEFIGELSPSLEVSSMTCSEISPCLTIEYVAFEGQEVEVVEKEISYETTEERVGENQAQSAEEELPLLISVDGEEHQVEQ